VVAELHFEGREPEPGCSVMTSRVPKLERPAQLDPDVGRVVERLLVDSLRLHLFGEHMESRWVLKIVVEHTDTFPG
jgi:hypothetical protein